MADEEVKTEEEIEENTEAAQEELPLETKAEEKTEEAVEAKVEEKTEAEEKPAVDWKDKELKKKHAQLMEARRQKEQDDAKIAALEALAGGNRENTERPNLQPAIPQAEIVAEAKKLRDQEKYNEDCNKVAADGEKAYGAEWKGAIENLQTLGGFTPEAMRGLLATDDPKKVLLELGKTPERYYQIMELPLERQIIEMGKIAMAPAQAKKVSEAPAPVVTVGGRAAPSTATTINDKMDDDTAYAILKAQRKKRFEEQNGIRR